MIARLRSIHFSDCQEIKIENSKFLINSKRTSNEYTTTIKNDGYYIISGIFYASLTAVSAAIHINGIQVSIAYGTGNVEMPVFYAGFISANTQIVISSTGYSGGNAGKNIISIISI